MTQAFWRGKRVYLTGHTGFMGGWLVLLLSELGAEVSGYSLDAPTQPNLFTLANIHKRVRTKIADIRDAQALSASLAEARPEVVFHLAAQPIVRRSYAEPLETFGVNVMGTANLLEAARRCGSVRAVVVVTSDKCYENREWPWGYREIDPMGGFDPYSASKGAAELVVASYRRSFFSQAGAAAVASVRAGNIIGGGDWAEDRLVPDFVRAVVANQPLRVRNPAATRPWQHVLDPLAAYLLLAQRLYAEGQTFAEAWNLGPADDDAKPVRWMADKMVSAWGPGARWESDGGEHPHEAGFLKLDCSKSRLRLGWRARWGAAEAVKASVDWYRAWHAGENMETVSLAQIEGFNLAGQPGGA